MDLCARDKLARWILYPCRTTDLAERQCGAGAAITPAVAIMTRAEEGRIAVRGTYENRRGWRSLAAALAEEGGDAHNVAALLATCRGRTRGTIEVRRRRTGVLRVSIRHARDEEYEARRISTRHRNRSRRLRWRLGRGLLNCVRGA